MTREAAPYHAAGSRVFNHAPRWFSALSFIIGAGLLGLATRPEKVSGLLQNSKSLVAEIPSLAIALTGFALMICAIGLARRMRVAYLFTATLLLLALVQTAIALPSAASVIICGLVFIGLIYARHAFFRRSDLSRMRPGGFWFLCTALVLAICTIGVALWAGHESGYIEAKWWDLIVSPTLGVAGRPLVLISSLLGLIAFATLTAAPTPPRLVPPDGDDYAQIAAILSQADGARPEASLAFAGDKSFLFSSDRSSFLMYAASKSTLVAMGGPVGTAKEHAHLINAFKTLADREGVTPALYALPPEFLPDLIDAGFAFEKIGESALLDLTTFSLSGRKREVIRRGRRKLAERRNGRFELSLPPHSDVLVERLRPISNAWLARNGGKEKSFSLGRFDPALLNASALGIVEIDGETAAFGSIWLTPDKAWAGIDLMRFDPDKAVTNTMDFLLVELILWAQQEGYKGFDLSMAPLAGLETPDASQLLNRAGQLIYQHGERFYNFKGLRRFKQKFNPNWEPRYIAVPKGHSLALALAEAARLTNKA